MKRYAAELHKSVSGFLFLIEITIHLKNPNCAPANNCTDGTSDVIIDLVPCKTLLSQLKC